MDGGLGALIFGIAIVSGVIFFIAGFMFTKILLRKSIFMALIVASLFAVAGFFAAPYIFEIYLRVRGIRIL
jgi:ABC-type multidrug transport system permease subunit